MVNPDNPIFRSPELDALASAPEPDSQQLHAPSIGGSVLVNLVDVTNTERTLLQIVSSRDEISVARADHAPFQALVVHRDESHRGYSGLLPEHMTAVFEEPVPELHFGVDRVEGSATLWHIEEDDVVVADPQALQEFARSVGTYATRKQFMKGL